MFRFLTRQHFIVNLLAAILLVFLLIMAFLWSLGFITHHGEYEKVPGVAGKSMKEAQNILEAKGFKVEVQDSLYYDSLPPLSVIKQSPEGEAMVKSNRTVYLTVNRSQPPLVELPNMVGFSFRNAEMYLKQLGLKLGDTTRVPDIARDAVRQQLYNGQPVTAGTKLFIGSKISFVLGNGLGEEEMAVPDLTGMTFEQAKATLAEQQLNVGALVVPAGVPDTLHAFVDHQYPRVKEDPDENNYVQMNKVRAGQGIDIWLRKTPPTEEELVAADSIKAEKRKAMLLEKRRREAETNK